jgi:hypothetical protein
MLCGYRLQTLAARLLHEAARAASNLSTNQPHVSEFECANALNTCIPSTLLTANNPRDRILLSKEVRNLRLESTCHVSALMEACFQAGPRGHS